MRGLVRRGFSREVSEEQVWEVDRTSLKFLQSCPGAEVDTSAQTSILALGVGSRKSGYRGLTPSTQVGAWLAACF